MTKVGKKTGLYLGGAILVSLLGAISLPFIKDRMDSESTNNAEIEADILFVSPEIYGKISVARASENKKVSAGEELVRLDPSDAEIRVTLAEKDLLITLSEKAAAAEELAGAQARLDLAKAEYDRSLSLKKSGVIPESEFDARSSAHRQALAARNLIQIKLSGTDGTDGFEARLAKAKENLRLAKHNLDRHVLKAPFPGTVTRVKALKDQFVTPGTPLMALVGGEAYVMANFKEEQIARMKVGDPVSFSVDAYPGEKFSGSIESIGPASGAKFALIPIDNSVGNFVKVNQRVQVKIKVTEGDRSHLLPGLSAMVTVRFQK